MHRADVANDTQTDLARDLLDDEESLPDASGPRTAEGICARAGVLALIGVANQIAQLVTAVDDLREEISAELTALRADIDDARANGAQR